MFFFLLVKLYINRISFILIDIWLNLFDAVSWVEHFHLFCLYPVGIAAWPTAGHLQPIIETYCQIPGAGATGRAGLGLRALK